MKRIALIATAALLSACAPQAPDVHDANRKPKAYESVKVADLTESGLAAHLNTLAQETNQAVEADQFGELHHLEIALTAALGAYEAKLPPAEAAAAKPILDELRTLAVKLHDAGHDRNATMAAKVNTRLQTLVGQL